MNRVIVLTLFAVSLVRGTCAASVGDIKGLNADVPCL